MKKLLLSTLSVFMLTGCWKKDDDGKKKFNKKQRKQIEKIVEKVLLAKPELVVKAMAKVLQSEEKKQRGESRKKVGARKAEIESTDTSYFFGPEKAEYTFTLFVDYNCMPCHKAMNELKQFVEGDSKAKDRIKVIIKPIAVLPGEKSPIIAAGMLAALEQGRAQYLALHNLVIAEKSALSEIDFMNLAAKVKGLDIEKLRKDMESSKIKDRVKQLGDLATAIGVTSTPSMVFDDIVAPGTLEADEYSKLVEALDKRKMASKDIDDDLDDDDDKDDE